MDKSGTISRRVWKEFARLGGRKRHSRPKNWERTQESGALRGAVWEERVSDEAGEIHWAQTLEGHLLELRSWTSPLSRAEALKQWLSDFLGE